MAEQDDTDTDAVTVVGGVEVLLIPRLRIPPRSADDGHREVARLYEVA